MSDHETGPLVLLAEDQAIIGMDVADGLADYGFRVAGPFATCEDATSWSRNDSPDLAVLDLNLRDGPCTDLANELAERNVPLVIFSGEQAMPVGFRDLRNVEWVQKPGSCDELVRALNRLSAVRITG